jgi:hypothetical protein
MKRLLGLVLVVPLLAASLVRGDDGIAPGNWKIVVLAGNGGIESTVCILKIEAAGADLSGKVEATSTALRTAKLSSFAVMGKQVRVVFKVGAAEIAFSGLIGEKTGLVKGTYGSEDSFSPAWMEPTTEKTLGPQNATRNLQIPQLQAIADLDKKVTELRLKSQKGKDQEQKAEMFKELAAAEKERADETPRLLRELVEKTPTSPAAGPAALVLIARSARRGAPDADVAMWCDLASKNAAPYGKQWLAEVNSRIADALLQSSKPSPLAAKYAELAERVLDSTTSPTRQVRMLETLVSAYKATGNTSGLKNREPQLTAILARLDKEYLSNVPPFKPAPSAGRKGESKRVAVMELFTGAQCPPCVAADVAFDALQHTYKPTELVLLQYHLHIPGPDPMTNLDTIERAKYYGARSTPSTFFNGVSPAPKTPAYAGGNMDGAEAKYKAYLDKIDPLLEEPTTVQLHATARQTGDKIKISAKVSGVEKPSPEMKVRLVLVEHTIRFIGSNKLRFHHQVVRAMPGGVAGFPVTKSDMEFEAAVDLSTLRNSLIAYLNKYADNERAFPQPQRPLDLSNLAVVAFVQNDETREIVQATTVHVGDH